jgi:biotin carboxyl carrier protein
MNKFVVTVNNKKLFFDKDDNGNIKSGENNYKVDLTKLTENAFSIKINNKIYEATVERTEGGYVITINGNSFKTTVRSLLEEKANEYLQKREGANADGKIKAPMPGLIVKVLKAEGEAIQKGEPLIILEAMKMENEIRATVSGIIKSVKVNENSSVEKGALLLEIN